MRIANTEGSDGQMEMGSKGIIQEWEKCCRAISEIASKFSEDPKQLEYLKDLQLQTTKLEKLQSSVASALEKDDHERLLKGFAQRMKALAARYSHSPIGQCAEQIHAQWTLAYPVDGDRTLESLREDVARAERALTGALEHWSSKRDRKSDLDTRLEEVKKQASDARQVKDRIEAEDREVDLQGDIAEVVKDMRIARDRVFSAAGPDGKSFDPTVSYGRDDRDVPVENLPSEENGQEVREQEAAVRGEDGADSASRGPTDEDTHTDEEASIPKHEEAAAVGEVEPEPRTHTAEPKPTPEHVEEAADHAPPDRTDTGDSREVTAAFEDTGSEPVEGLDGESKDRELAPPGNPALQSLWRCLETGRLGIAHHVARLQGDSNGASLVQLAKVIAAATLARHTYADHGEIVNALSGLIGDINPDDLLSGSWEDHERDAVNVLLFCASLRPALFAPSTGAASLLDRVTFMDGLTPIKELARTVTQQGEWLRQRGVRHSASTFKVTPTGTWREAFDSLVKRVGDWQRRAKAKRHVFSGADRVWHALLRDKGCLKEICELVSQDEDASKNRVEEICRQISDRKLFYDLVRRTDRGRKINPIEGLALKQLWNDVQPAREFGAEWQRLMDVKPPPAGFVGQRITAFRDGLGRCSSDAADAIENALNSENPEALLATLRQARTAVSELREILDGENPSGDSIEHPDAIQSRDLAFVTELDLDPRFNPRCLDDRQLLTMLMNNEAHADSLRTAFDARLQRGDLVGALLTLDLIATEEAPEFDSLREALLETVDRRQRDLRKTLGASERQVEYAFCRGQIDTDERKDMAAKLSAVRKVELTAISENPTPNGLEALTGAFSELSGIDRMIESSRRESVTNARTRLRKVSTRAVDDDARSIVMRAITEGDLLTANEQIARLEEGESVVPPPVEDDPFRDFWEIVKEVERALEAPDMTRPEVERRIMHREGIASLSFGDLTETEIKGATSLLDAWHGVARTRRLEENSIRNLFQRLGFRVVGISTDQLGRGWPCAIVKTALLEDRAVCPSRQFGSEAAGQYRVLLNWDRPADEAILRPLEGGGLVPTIVLHFGCLGASREKLRARAVQTHRLFLVVDEALMLFLTTRPSGRLSALFRCSLPFSSSEPYATTSGVVPPELFYGRKRERQAVMDQSGACFIYGGRQLGKTALLRSVERDFNRSGSPQTRVAKWIDLKANEIGYQLGPSDIWLLLQRELRRLNLTDMGRPELDPGANRQVTAFLDRIRKWLDERKDRRLLLLLDEADEFLNRDAETDFRESARLKLLMDQTERRFKVVFAGLHNVLRTTQQANHPLAHLGDPIRVGAMLSNGEWKEAQALVREPLQAIGCRFERHDLSTRVLAQTNYYPSLIQLYGAELVHRLRDSSKTFPYEIDDDDIDGAYARRELRSAIRERFLLTLQLDPRYEVIAYALAFELHDGDLRRGIDRSALLEKAQDWWQKGFDALPDVEFNMLLHEMEGLGVLQELDQHRYTLRNPNILLLLGNSQDIENALSRPRKLPTVYEAKSFRARYPGDIPSKARRGPLTYQQESDLRKGGVAVVSGCNAAGLEKVHEFLSLRIGGKLFQQLAPVSDRSDFEEELKAQRPARNEVTVYLLPSEVNWDTTWLTRARAILGKKAGGGRLWSRVAFIAEPERLWNVLNDSKESDLFGVDWIGLSPCDDTFLRRWLDDISATADDDHVARLIETTGGWPRALDNFRANKRMANRPWLVQMEKTHNSIKRHSQAWIRQEFGLSEGAERLLRKLAEADDPFDEESIELVGSENDFDLEELQRRVAWGERLGLLERAGSSDWTFNPLVKRLLKPDDPA